MFEKKDDKVVLVFSVLITAFLILGFYYEIFTIIALIISAFLCVFLKPSKFSVILIYLLPWAYVFKLSFFTTSLYVILYIIASLIFFFKSKKHNILFILLLLIFSAYLLIPVSNTDKYIFVIKLIFAIFLLYYMIKLFDYKDKYLLLVMFIFSVVLCSITGLIYADSSILANRINIEGSTIEATYVRFTGLSNDPNYYNLNVVFALFATMFLFLKNKIKFLFYPLFVLLFFFGTLTYSKSFLLLFIILLCYLIYFLFRARKKYTIISIFILLLLMCFLIINGKIENVNVIIRRFNDESSDLTTGRTEIFYNYLNYILTHPKTFVLGDRFNIILLNNRAAHNTYIDVLYYFGAVGSIIFITLLFLSLKSKQIKINVYSILFLTLVSLGYFFLSGIISLELMFHLFLFSTFCTDTHNYCRLYKIES